MITLSDNLKSLRKNKGLTQLDIGKYLGITRAGYSRYENGSNEPSIGFLVKLADLYDVSVDELIGRQLNQKCVQLREMQEHKEIKATVRSVSEKVIKDFIIENEEILIKKIADLKRK